MTVWQLILHSIRYYWRTNLAVLLGVIAGTAVIGGALIVGDSVKGSLRQMTLDRLGKIDYAVSSHRFFRRQLAEETGAAPALVMPGSLTFHDGKETHRSNRVNVFGIGNGAWDMIDHGNVELPAGNDVVLSATVAEELHAKAGSELTLWIELPASIPRDSLLGKRDNESVEIDLTVTAVLAEDSGAGRLELNPNQQLPNNAFVALETLQSRLNLSEQRDRRTRSVSPARVNTLFVSAQDEAAARDVEAAAAKAAELNNTLAGSLTLADLRLRIVENERFDYLSLESEQQILESLLADAGRRAAEQLNAKTSPVLVYLANEIANPEREDAYSMYSVVAGLDLPKDSSTWPFGAFEFIGASPQLPLGEKDIILNDWLADDLQAEIGDEVTLAYHLVGSHGELPEEVRRFRVRGIVKLDGTAAADRGLTPDVQGITDAKTFGDWEQPFPMDLTRITDRDEDYWDRYKATPKAFVSLSAAQALWKSRYGQLTSLRVAPPEGHSLDGFKEEFEAALLGQIDPQQAAVFFQPVKAQGLQASSGTTDFSGLFFAFSFFLILSATILIGLLFRLGIERRSRNVGLLGAVGFAPRRVRRLFLLEGLLVVVAGGVLGVAAAWGYAAVMVYGLKTWWYGAIGTKFLNVYVTPQSLVLGFAISVIVAGLAVWWALRQLRGLSTRDLLSGATEVSLTTAARRSRSRRAISIAAVCGGLSLLVVLAALVGLVPSSEAFEGFSWEVVAFFVVGALLLTASLEFLSGWLDTDRSAAVRGAGLAGMGRLGLRNAARHRQRSVLTTGLIASATFVIVTVAASHRNPAEERPRKDSGNGGFALVAETTTPILKDLNSSAARNELGLEVENPDADRAKALNDLLAQMNVYAFPRRPGEEASCLNIYQTQMPTILGVPQRLIERGGFKFSGADRENPWTLLNEGLDDTTLKPPTESGKSNQPPLPTIPVLGDMNTLQYSLHKSVGDVIVGPTPENPRFALELAGKFDGSVFQGVLLMSEENFRRLFPERSGFEYFLIDATGIETQLERRIDAVQKRLGELRDQPQGASGDGKIAALEQERDELQSIRADVPGWLSDVLETDLDAYGFDAERVSVRLARFLAVQNTYLSTFQTLGGLGLLLGTLGLATVMLRNVLERRSELALLRAVGFRWRGLAWLVLWENAFLLLWGLTAGTVSALLATAPHLATIGADVPWQWGGAILAGVFVVGMLAALLAVKEAVRTPIVATLRSE